MILPNLNEFFSQGLACGPSREAIIGPSKSVNYQTFAQLATDSEKALAARGFEPGHRLAIEMSPTADKLALLIAGLRRGMLIAILPSSLDQGVRQRRLDEFRPHATIRDGFKISGLSRPGPPGRDRAPALILWTSGSSGPPKAVAFHPDAIFWNALASAKEVGFRPEDRTLVLLDAGYCYALVHQIFGHLAVGGTVVANREAAWLPGSIGEMVRQGITTLVTVPSLLKSIVNLPNAPDILWGIRVVTVGGAPVPEQLITRLQAVAPNAEIYITYGLTEAGPRVCTRRCDPPQPTALGAVGRPLPGVDVKADADGQLMVRSPSARFAALINGTLSAMPDWIATGDLGSVAGDGCVYVSGRIRPVINRSGVKIIPSEIERVLCSHPKIRTALVVSAPHERLGQVPMAYVVPCDEAPSPFELAQYCRQWLSDPWIPVEIRLVSELPTVLVSTWKTG
jgi:acyl-CoA synthetase (AMP-forming)/AMP-acid ligase II